MREKRGKTVQLGELLRGYLDDQNALEVSLDHMVPVIWKAVVGEWYGRHTRVSRVWEGIVDVECDSAARAQQLQLDSAQIIGRLNERLGERYVRQLRPSSAGRLVFKEQEVAHGLRGYVSPAPTAAELEAVKLPEAEERWLDEQAAVVPEGAARDNYARALRVHLKLRQWKIEHGWEVCPKCGVLYDTRQGCLDCRRR